MKDNLAYIWLLLKTNMKSAMTLKVVYAFRLIFNISNHALYMTIWIILFDQIDSIGGWGIEHILLAYGIGIMVWGLLSFFGFGLRKLPQKIDDGELDVYLTHPRPLLINIAMGSPQAAGPPEIVFGMIILTIAGVMTGVSIPLLFLMVICATIVFSSIVLAIGSLGFWLKDFQTSGEELNFNVFLLSTRPEGVFQGWLEIVIVTLIPVSFMTYMPIDFLLTHKISSLIGVLGGTCVCMGISYFIFTQGLKRYESGNRFGVHG